LDECKKREKKNMLQWFMGILEAEKPLGRLRLT